MNQDPPNSKSNRTRERLAGGIGATLGGATGFAIGELLGVESFWLGLILVAGCIGLGGVLAQKIASK